MTDKNEDEDIIPPTPLYEDVEDSDYLDEDDDEDEDEDDFLSEDDDEDEDDEEDFYPDDDIVEEEDNGEDTGTTKES